MPPSAADAPPCVVILRCSVVNSPLPSSTPPRCLRDRREFMAIRRYAGYAFHAEFVERQHHEHVVRHFPLARDAPTASGHESEARVIRWMSEHNDEGTRGCREHPVPFHDEAT